MASKINRAWSFPQKATGSDRHTGHSNFQDQTRRAIWRECFGRIKEEDSCPAEGQAKVALEVESRSKQGCPTEKGLEEPLDLKDEHLQEADIQERSKVLGEGQGCVW